MAYLTSEPDYVLNIKLMDESLHKYYDKSKPIFHDGDSGFDLYSSIDTTITNANIFTTFHTGIQAEMIKRYYRYRIDGSSLTDPQEVVENVSYNLMSRSSITGEGLVLGNSVGLIDAGYRGEIMARVYAVTNNDGKTYPAGTRLFQIVGPGLVKFRVNIVDVLSDTTRGTGGFGSTGK